MKILDEKMALQFLQVLKQKVSYFKIYQHYYNTDNFAREIIKSLMLANMWLSSYIEIDSRGEYSMNVGELTVELIGKHQADIMEIITRLKEYYNNDSDIWKDLCYERIISHMTEAWMWMGMMKKEYEQRMIDRTIVLNEGWG